MAEFVSVRGRKNAAVPQANDNRLTIYNYRRTS
jgi:hypothetical protein